MSYEEDRDNAKLCYISGDWVALIHNYYQIPGNGAGGVLHIVLDDGNLEDSNLMFCENAAKKAGDAKALEIITLMWRMSMAQREKLYAEVWAR